jgi:hypothetical protein
MIFSMPDIFNDKARYVVALVVILLLSTCAYAHAGELSGYHAQTTPGGPVTGFGDYDDPVKISPQMDRVRLIPWSSVLGLQYSTRISVGNIVRLQFATHVRVNAP